MKIDFYTQIHKALRRWLFNVSIEMGCTDYTNIESCQKLHSDLMQLFALLSIHANHEKEFYHPLIAIKLNKANQLDIQHEVQEKALIELEKKSKAILNLDNPSQRTQQSLALYTAYNRFLAHYLQHLDEEESLMPLLQDVASEEELLQALQALVASLTQKEILDSITYMLPALNPQERLNMMQVLLSDADKTTHNIMNTLAEQALLPADWLFLKNQLGVLINNLEEFN